MSRNATASWSGYAHQGKIALLVALRKINALHGTNANLTDYVLSCETQEDASISHLANVLEVHQVKAYVDKTTIGGYTGALADFEPCPGSNYLHSICNITNWNVMTAAQNPHGVDRYPYSANRDYCSLSDIFGYLDAEIFTLLSSMGHPQQANEGWRENGFQEFLALLDEKIRYEHEHHDQDTYDIRFTLREIAEIMQRQPVKSRSKLWAIRKNLYQQYLEFIDQLEANAFQIGLAHEQKVMRIIGEIYGLPDQQFIQFLCNINPHTTEGQVFETCEATDNFFVGSSFYGTFLQTLIEVTLSEYVLDAKVIPSYFKECSYLMTAIESTELQKKFHAKRILDNQVTNFSGYENDYFITQSYEGRLEDCAQKLIERDPLRFTSKKDMKFIPIAQAVDILNQ